MNPNTKEKLIRKKLLDEYCKGDKEKEKRYKEDMKVQCAKEGHIPLYRLWDEIAPVLSKNFVGVTICECEAFNK